METSKELKNSLMNLSVYVSHGTETGLNQACFDKHKLKKWKVHVCAQDNFFIWIICMTVFGLCPKCGCCTQLHSIKCTFLNFYPTVGHNFGVPRVAVVQGFDWSYRKKTVVQAALVKFGLFICDFAYIRSRNGLFSGTYPLIYSNPWCFYMQISYMRDYFFEPLSLAYNEVHLYF